MKYRQPGYRDQDYKEEREKRKQDDKGPRGPREPRGMAREARLVTRCYQCGHQEQALDSVPTDALCPKCRAARTPAATACTSIRARASSAAADPEARSLQDRRQHLRVLQARDRPRRHRPPHRQPGTGRASG